jgi:DNA replication protein DnaC
MAAARPWRQASFRSSIGMRSSAPTIADAILDRLVHNAHRLTLKGESLRKAAAKRQKLDDEPAN